MEIRKVKLEDLEEILKLEKEIFKEDSYDETIFLYYIIYNKDYFLVVENNKKIIGYAIISIDNINNKAHLVSIGIKKEFRRKGIGKNLLKKLINKVLKLKIKKIELEVKEKNLEAINFYKKLGFEEEKLIKNYYKDGTNAIKMVKKLTN